jgi:F-type H+-transporting ATPase subunit O
MGVLTRAALEEEVEKDVEGAVKGFLKGKEKALITWSVDPNLIGGMVITVGDKFCDMSMSSKLKKYSELIKGAA